MNLTKHFKIYAVTLVLLSAGCTSQKYALDTTKTTFKDLLGAIEREQQKIVSISSSSRISVDSPEFSGNFFADILYQEPDSLLIAATGPFGISAGTLFIGRERFIFYNQIANRFYTGSVDEYRERNFFQFPLKLSELLNVFAGKEHLSAMKIVEYTLQDDQFLIKSRRGDIIYEIFIEPQNGQITKLTAFNNDNILYIREYDDFIENNGIIFPRKISMIRPGENQAVSVYHTQISVNELLDKSRFQVRISDRAEQIDYSNYNGY